LYQDAFRAIANPSDGNVSVTWTFVPCGISSPLFVRNKSGTSKWWFAMQVVNNNIGVSALEISIDGTRTWQSTTRREYNYFEKQGGGGFGSDYLDVRITATDGRQLIIPAVSVVSEFSKVAGGNF
jgi:expansin (peptidoglycan-binding protein)